MYKGIEITSPEEFLEVIESMEASYNKIKNVIDKEQKNVERINETDVWTGKAAETVYEKYKLLNSNYEQIDYSLDLYIKFLRKVLEDYTRWVEESGKNIEGMSTSLDVNS